MLIRRVLCIQLIQMVYAIVVEIAATCLEVRQEEIAVDFGQKQVK